MQAEVAKSHTKNESSNCEIVKKERDSCWCYYCTLEWKRAQKNNKCIVIIEKTSAHVVCALVCVYVLCVFMHAHM